MDELIKEGYDILECPNCETTCKPDAKRVNGTIVYERHFCQNKYELEGSNRGFEIDIEGNLVE